MTEIEGAEFNIRQVAKAINVIKGVMKRTDKARFRGAGVRLTAEEARMAYFGMNRMYIDALEEQKRHIQFLEELRSKGE